LQVRSKFKHAVDFEVQGNPSRENFELFKNNIIDHLRDPSTVLKKDTYTKTIDVIHYLNEDTAR